MMRCFALLLLPSLVGGQSAEFGRGWMSEFDHAARQIVALAEATPESKFTWRPAPGVRSTAELYMHVAFSNYWLLHQAGGPIPDDTPSIDWKSEKTITRKADVVRWLKSSFDAVRAGQRGINRTKSVRFLDREVPAEAVLLRLLVHNHEHMGQAIAYARICGVVPPWSPKGAE